MRDMRSSRVFATLIVDKLQDVYLAVDLSDKRYMQNYKFRTYSDSVAD